MPKDPSRPQESAPLQVYPASPCTQPYSFTMSANNHPIDPRAIVQEDDHLEGRASQELIRSMEALGVRQDDDIGSMIGGFLWLLTRTLLSARGRYRKIRVNPQSALSTYSSSRCHQPISLSMSANNNQPDQWEGQG